MDDATRSIEHATDEPPDDPTPRLAPDASGDRHAAESLTRGFLFADLRGYTDFVEKHGAEAAAGLLFRYRPLVRDAIARFDGAEIRTEGDSFYVVFGSVSAAVRCGMLIVSEANRASAEHPDEPIRVGVGIHAGETVETPEGHVGSSVNIAARICSQASAGEVLVSDTVRALIRTTLPVRFEDRGRRRLKGVADPIALFSVSEIGTSAPTWGAVKRSARRRRLVILVAAVAVVGLGGAAAFRALRTQSGLPAGDWTIGLDGPLTGGEADRGVPFQNSVKLALDAANGSAWLNGSRLVLDARDDGGDVQGDQDPVKGAANAAAMVADPRTLAMVGPWASFVATSVIPVTNAAGLLECSPTNTLADLTKPRYGALDLRSAHPDRINYVRLAPADDIQAVALASFALRDLGATFALVIDDTGFGREIADGFAAAFTKLGGRVVRLALNPGADPETVLGPLANASDRPGVVFFGGLSNSGAPDIRRAMAAGGHATVPFLSWDGIFDGSGNDPASYIRLAGPSAVGSYLAHASIPAPTHSFVESYRTAFGTEPNEYAGAAYACTEVIIEALHAAATGGTGASGLREAVRAYAVDPAHRYETVVGNVGFDQNGDSIQQFVTFYHVEASAAGGTGDWVISKQQDFGPAP